METNLKQLETALLTEHFRYTPMTLLDEIVNTMNEVVNRAIDAAEQGLLSTDPAVLGFADRIEALKRTRAKNKVTAAETSADGDGDDDDAGTLAQKEIEEGVYQLETLLNSTVDHVFDKFEIYVLRNLLSIPEELIPWMRLEHYKNLDFGPAQEDEPTQESIRALARKVTETKKLEMALKREVAGNDALIAELDHLMTGDHHTGENIPPPASDDGSLPPRPSVSFLTSGPSAKSIGLSFSTPAPLSSSTGPTRPSALQTHTGFVMSQLSHLEQLLSYLRPKLKETPFSASKVVLDNSITEKDPLALRTAYLESRSRKIVSRFGMGLAGASGSVPNVAGATTADLGRYPGMDELEALESLAGPLKPGVEER